MACGKGLQNNDDWQDDGREAALWQSRAVAREALREQDEREEGDWSL
jgi:hypothetical protein